MTVNNEKVNTVFHVEDISSGFKDFPFTDGAGNIYFTLSKEINLHFRLRFCVAYQIRLAGYEGVLALKSNPMKGLVEVRPSMNKLKGASMILASSSAPLIEWPTLSTQMVVRMMLFLLHDLAPLTPAHQFLNNT